VSPVAELSRKSAQKVIHLGSELDRDAVVIGFPVRVDEELYGIPLFVQVHEDDLGVDVLEAFGTSSKLFGPGHILWWSTEIEPKPKESAITCRKCTESTEVMTGKVLGALG
jgi:hypothetical protein